MSFSFSSVTQFLRTHVKVLVGGLVAVVVLIVGFLAVSPAPRAQGALKGHLVEISRNGSFRVVFSQLMNRRSAESAFRITPAVEGSFIWEGRDLIFDPTNDLEKGKTYEVMVTTAAKSLAFKSLTSEYRQSFLTVDYPEVSLVAPVDKTTIMPDQLLTVLFDRPLRTLTGSLDVPEYLRISPEVKGTYHWLGIAGFEFVPENGWPAARSFTITIPKGTKVADGGSTIEDKVWSFSTPAVSAEFLGVYQHLRPKEPVSIVFNYPVAPEALAKDLVIKEGGQTRSNDEFSFEVHKDNPNAISIKRKQDFELGKTYEFSLAQGVTLGLGDLGLVSAWRGNVNTDELGFKFVKSFPKNGESKAVGRELSLCFNNPLDEATVKDAIEISPKLEDFQTYPYAYLSEGCQNDSATMMISGRWKPSTDYTVTLKASMADIYGQKLSEPVVIRFKTDAYQPSVEVSTYSLYGVLAAHLPRVYQLRTMNWGRPINAKLESISFEKMGNLEVSGSPIGNRSYDTSAPLNTAKILDVDLDQIAGRKLTNGYYKLNFDDLGKQTYAARSLIITDTALTLKRDVSSMLVWATDLKSGAVVANLPVRIWAPVSEYDRSALKKVVEGKTNAEGIARLSLDESMQFEGLIVEGSDATRLAYAETDWSDGISVWNYGLERSYARGSERHIGYLYTDRRIYRPDQEVFFKGVVRLDSDARLSLPTAKEVDVVIEDGQSKEVWSGKLPLNSYGTFNGKFKLEPSMSLGTFRIGATATLGKETTAFDAYMDVREYRRPDFKVETIAPAETAFAGQQIKIPVKGEYYYGMPLAGAKVNYQVNRTKLFFQPIQGRWWNDWYSFTMDGDMSCYWYCSTSEAVESVQSGEAVLDDKGMLTLELPSNLTDYASSANYTVDVTVTDVNRRIVSSRLEFPVYKSEYYMGIRSNYDRGWSDPTATFDVMSVNVDGSTRADVDATVKLYKRVWTSSRKAAFDGNNVYDWQKTDTLVETKSVKTDREGKAVVSFNATKDGEYVAVVESRDGRRQTVSASVSRYVYLGSGDAVRTTDDHQMKIIQTKASYDVGDTASLAVQTPYENTKALVTIERQNVREYRVIDLGSKQRTIDVKITDAETPNIYVSVLAVKGGGETNIPEFRLGYANLQVNTTKKILNMTVTPDREVHRPGEAVTLTIETKNSAGVGVPAEASIAVVDERIIALLGNIDNNILGKFWFPRLIGVETAQTLTKLVKKVFFSTEGGAGGKGDNSGPAVRGNFKDTAYWNAMVVTGADGKARVSFTLPDNLTSWNVMAIATTKNTEVGSAQTKLVTRRDVMVEPLLPRILRHGDTVTIGATVVNATDQAVDANVDIKVEGLTISNPGTRKVRLDPQSRRVVNWNVTVPVTGNEAKVTVSAKAGNYQDGFELKVPVLEFSVPEVVSASGFLEKNVTETVQIPDGIMPNNGGVEVSVQPTIGSGLTAGISYINTYPYRNAEQRASNLIANLMHAELVKLKAIKESATTTEAINEAIRDDIKVLVSSQRGDGAWGFWIDSYSYYPWLTSHVMWSLTQAQKAGFTVDADTLNRADAYLRATLFTAGSTHVSDAERAQTLFMLSERNTADLAGYAAGLFDRRADLPQFAKVFLALTYTNLDANVTSARATQLLNDVKNAVVYLNPTTAYVKESKDYYELLSSDLRTTSVYLQALLRIDPKNEQNERLVRYLVQNKKDGYWYNTYETALTILGLVEYVRANPIDQSAAMVTLYLNNQVKGTLPFPQGDVSPTQTKTFSVSELGGMGATQQIGLEKDSTKRYLYDINMRVYREIQDIDSFSNGMTVVADAYALTDSRYQRPLTEIAQGENVQVRLKVLVPKRHRYVSLEYHLPAGLEGIDFQLKTSPQYLAGQEQQCYPGWDGKQRCLATGQTDWWWENVWRHIEYRDDRVYLFADTLEPGVYEYSFIAQAMTPGEYRVPPARVYETYNPLANGHNEGKVFKVLAK
jgi:uncharacterized protein YfaS (alpha-2-macroglobulin family)